jgi:hypothetical protein
VVQTIAAFQRNAFQNNAFQVGSDYFDGGAERKKKRAWRLEDLYNFAQKNTSELDQKKLAAIVKPFTRPTADGKSKIEFEQMATHKIAYQQVASYIQELYNTRQDLKDRIIKLINIEFLKQGLEAKKLYEENLFIFMILMDE